MHFSEGADFTHAFRRRKVGCYVFFRIHCLKWAIFGESALRLIPYSADNGGWAACGKKELPEFQLDVFVAALHEKCDVLNDMLYNVNATKRLGPHTRAVAVM